MKRTKAKKVMNLFRLREVKALKEHFGCVGSPVELVQAINNNNDARREGSAGKKSSNLEVALTQTFAPVVPEQTSWGRPFSSPTATTPLSFRSFLESILLSASAAVWTNNANLQEFVLSNQQASSISIHRNQCHSLLSHAFLGNLQDDPMAKLKRDYSRAKGLDLSPLYWTDCDTDDVAVPQNDNNCAVEKLKCILQYFIQTTNDGKVDDAKEDDVITLERHQGLEVETFQDQFLSSSCPINKDLCEITLDPMETPRANAMVNFANPIYGVGGFVDPQSCTQEEILQVCCPEINVGMLFHGALPPNGVCIAHNIKRYSTYSGYGSSFRYGGPITEPFADPQSIIFMDASITNDPQLQFDKNIISRDVQKAYWGFARAAKPQNVAVVISTGKWGCGAFGGDVVLKFLQQMMAISLVNNNGEVTRRLIFSSFRNAKQKDMLQNVLDAAHGVPVYKVFDILQDKTLFQHDNDNDKYRSLVATLQSLKQT